LSRGRCDHFFFLFFPAAPFAAASWAALLVRPPVASASLQRRCGCGWQHKIAVKDRDRGTESQRGREQERQRDIDIDRGPQRQSTNERRRAHTGNAQFKSEAVTANLSMPRQAQGAGVSSAQERTAHLVLRFADAACLSLGRMTAGPPPAPVAMWPLMRSCLPAGAVSMCACCGRGHGKSEGSPPSQSKSAFGQRSVQPCVQPHRRRGLGATPCLSTHTCTHPASALARTRALGCIRTHGTLLYAGTLARSSRHSRVHAHMLVPG
jgi:hypothetical protein